MTMLAIFCPKIGERSVTFIRRHIEELAPGKVVVVTFGINPEFERSWNVSCPVLVIKDLSFEKTRHSRLVQRVVPAGVVRRYYAYKIVGFLKEHNVDAILGQYLHQSWPFIQIAKQLGIRFYGHAHGYDLSKYWNRALWRRRYADYRYTSGVIVVNRVMRERMLSAGIPAELIHIVPYGVDVPANMPTRVDCDHCRFLAVGRMVEKKAPLKTLEAFSLALEKNPNLSLDYIGTGPLYANVEAYIDERGLQESVHLHGGQNHSYVIGMMRKADCFVQHSVVDPWTLDEEGVPVAILEAMAQGLPVISTNHTGIPEAVDHDQSGLLVEEGDFESMSQAMLKIGSDLELRKFMGKLAWKTAKERFSWEREKERLCQILSR